MAWKVWIHRRLEERKTGLKKVGEYGRGALWDSVDNVERDGSLVGSARGDAGSPDAVVS